MAKRAAENQLTKDDAEDAGSGEENQQTSGSGPAAPVEGRVIRGMPKRKGLGTQPATTSSAVPASSNPFASLGAPASSTIAPQPAFSFGAPAATAAATPTSTFSFGGPSAGSAAISKPAAPFSGFSFGSGASAPANAAAPTSASAEPAKASAFGGFSFGQPAKAAAADAASTPAEVPKTAAAPFSGFSFAPKPSASGAPPAQSKAASTAASSSSTFSFGQTAPVSSSSTFGDGAAAPKPFAGFSFSSAPASEQAEPSSSKVYPDLPKEDGATSSTAEASSTLSSGMPKPPLPGSFSFGKPSSSAVPTQSTSMPVPKLDGMPAPPSGGFSFGASSSAKADGLPKPASNSFSFGAASSSAPSVTTSAPSNGFGFGSGPKTPSAPSASIPTTAAPPAKPPTAGADDLKYLTSLRGLNHSFAQALVYKVQDDPFCDLGEILDRLRDEYDQHLAGVQEKAGLDVPKRKRQRANGESSSSSGLASSLNARPQVTGGSDRDKTSDVQAVTKPVNSEEHDRGSMDSDKADENRDKAESAAGPAKPLGDKHSSSAVSMFRDIVKQSSAPENQPAQPSSDAVMDSPSTGEAKRLPQDTDSPANKRKSAIFSITPTIKPAASGSTTPAGTPSKAQPSMSAGTFSLGSGGSPAPAASPSFGMPQRPRTVSTGFSFGAAAGDKAKSDAPTEPPKPAFSFGAGASTFSFGNPAASSSATPASQTPAVNPFASSKDNGAPTAFSFGAPASKAPSAVLGSAPPNPFAPASTSAFSFGAAGSASSTAAGGLTASSLSSASQAPEKAPEASQDKEEGEASEAPANQGPDLSKVMAPAKGEEDEDTVWQSTARLLKKLEKDGKPTWGETQDAYIKVNRLRGTGGAEDEENASLMRRIIVRNVATGKLILNFSLKNLLALAAMTKQSAIRISIPNADGKIDMYLFAFSKEESAPAKAAACLRAIQKERRGLGLNDFSQLP